MPVINTIHGKYRYKAKALYQGIKRIDKQIAFENLCLFKSLCEKNNYRFFLAYGTLLGAIREKDFIEHDEDIDLGALFEDKDVLLSMLFELRDNGFEVIRWDERGLMSIMRKGEYIDIYMYKPLSRNLYAVCGAPFPKEFIDNQTIITFKGVDFYAPTDSEKNLEFFYGKEWRTPVIDNDYSVSWWKIMLYKITCWVKQIYPDFLKKKYFAKQELAAFNRYYSKGILDKYLDEEEVKEIICTNLKK